MLDVRAKVNSFDGIGVVSKGLSRPEQFTRMKEVQIMITKLLCHRPNHSWYFVPQQKQW